jgi:general secretion pathway protein J
MRQAGFTVLELLVGLTLMGLLAVLLATSIRSGLNVTNRVEARATDTGSMIAAHRGFRDLVETVFPLRADDAHGANARFQGGVASLDLVGPARAEPSGGSLAGLVAYRLDLADNRMTLVDPRGDRHLVTALPDGASLAYFGAPSRNEPARWLAEWKGRAEFPLLVRLRVPGWPDAVGRPRSREAIR